MIFLTVGTLLPFDRLVMAVDDAVGRGLITEEIIAQIGVGAKRPKNFASSETLDKDEYDSLVANSSAMISHAGMGAILAALNMKKPLLVMPRLHKFREIINDHQLLTAEKFEKFGRVLAVYETRQIPEKFNLLKTFVPHERQTQLENVIEKISGFLDNPEEK